MNSSRSIAEIKPCEAGSPKNIYNSSLSLGIVVYEHVCRAETDVNWALRMIAQGRGPLFETQQ